MFGDLSEIVLHCTVLVPGATGIDIGADSMRMEVVTVIRPSNGVGSVPYWGKTRTPLVSDRASRGFLVLAAGENGRFRMHNKPV